MARAKLPLMSSTDTSSKTIVTRSKPNAFPSLLRSKKSEIQTLAAGDAPKDALIDQECPGCKAPQMRHYTVQLRGADEGTTVAFYCEECHYKWVLLKYVVTFMLTIYCQFQHEQLRKITSFGKI